MIAHLTGNNAQENCVLIFMKNVCKITNPYLSLSLTLSILLFYNKMIKTHFHASVPVTAVARGKMFSGHLSNQPLCVNSKF